MSCLTCQHLTARDKTGRVYDLVRHGFWRCARTVATFRGLRSPGCEMHERAPAEVVEARETWLERRRG